MSETLGQLETQVNLLYASCNSISLSVQQLLESQIINTNNLTQLSSQVQSLSSQQTSDIGSINLLNNELTQLIYYQNLSILSQNNTTFKNAVLTNSTELTASSPITLEGTIGGSVSYVMIGNGNYNKILYSFNNYQSAAQSFPMPNALENPYVRSDLANTDYTVSSDEVVINATTGPLNGFLMVEGLLIGNTLTPAISAPTSGSYQILFVNVGPYKKYMIYFDAYINDTGISSTLSFELPFSNSPFVENETTDSLNVTNDGITIPSSSISLTGYLIVEGW